MKLLKKITVKGVFGDLKSAVLASAVKDGKMNDGVVVPVMRVVGKCIRYEIKSTDFGDSICLKGNFQATNLATGEIFRGNTCYLPETAADMVAGAMEDDTASVEFGFDIEAVSDSGVPTGYTYTVTPLIKPQEDDALSRLAASLPQIPQLAIAAEAEPEQAPKAKAKK